MEIKNSLDWESASITLKRQIASLKYDPALRQMLKNIDDMVGELSRKEVDARRTKSTYATDEQLKKINQSIDTLEQFIILGVLYE